MMLLPYWFYVLLSIILFAPIKSSSVVVINKISFRRLPMNLYLTKRAEDISTGPQQSVAAQVQLRIQYCGGWGYDRFCDALEEAINKEFPGIVGIERIRDISTTGNFEVTLLQTNQLLHSKTTQGLGKCESEIERKRLFAFIKIYLSYLEKKKMKAP